MMQSQNEAVSLCLSTATHRSFTSTGLFLAISLFDLVAIYRLCNLCMRISILALKNRGKTVTDTD